MDAATLTYDTLRFAELEEFPQTEEPVWILGRESSSLTEKDDILCDISSRLWFTYRKNFPPIGGTGPTSDTGWGCMLRCGQMILGEALVFRHLGRDWRWVKGKRQREEYYSILKAFIDKKDSYYSIHQIAQMGVGEGKSIGQWYGPNTVAQVLKKLSVFDSWSRLAVHVAMDNTVVIEEIKRLCMPWLDYAGAAAFLDPDLERELNGFTEGACAQDQSAVWKPLVLLIPLRLGLSEINEAYIETLKKCFMLPQSLGVIGGKPNSAHYFIGYVGEELIYLDPHTTQPSVEPCDDGLVPDDSYHCEHPPCRMHIRELDPSIAVGFFCSTEEDFDDWCLHIRKMSGRRDALPMFELVDRQPSHFMSSDVLNTPGGSENQTGGRNTSMIDRDFSDSDHLERFFDSEDEEFEILSL
ncbi:cysteine protease ATG4B-like isoform X2 [Polyodon spathula]|uniref:cysteine protease ATG4B-like isoform X2 n=1 Tax=Polyodon spathula TaxID=7913 RepID=UPI001B7DCE3A|nr:cysteine protease ATG4B-like isoform X2 [Polyodon spathula]